jgi:3-deoxy-manno-octulosonate cytidylyltransferase (CMP-KDO synthetase)
MKVIGIIPARYGSSRLPGKPLAMILGKSMIQRVYEQASQAQLDKVVVATDDERILAHVHSFGGNACLTSADHPSGTDRCLEALQKEEETYDVVINIQGDEPFIHPSQIDKLSACFDQEETQIATLAKKITQYETLIDRNKPKASFNNKGKALAFERLLKEEVSASDFNKKDYYKHLGIYAYRSDTLQEICRLTPTANEQKEQLEQLRWLDNGYHIHIELTELESLSVDTPEDLKKIESLHKS